MTFHQFLECSDFTAHKNDTMTDFDFTKRSCIIIFMMLTRLWSHNFGQ